MDLTSTELQFKDLKVVQDSLQRELKQKSLLLQEVGNQLGGVKNEEQHYLHEIEQLQIAETAALNNLSCKCKQIEEEFVQENQDFTLELIKQDEEITKLKLQLQELLDNTEIVNCNRTNGAEENTDEESLFSINNIITLQEEVQEKQVLLERLEEDNWNLSETVNSLRQQSEELQKNIACKIEDIGEAYKVIKNLEDNVVVTKNEVCSMKNKPIKVGKDENSLFGEVNERRLVLQSTLLNSIEKSNNMKQELVKKEKHISTLYIHNVQLKELLQNDPIECMEDYKILLDLYQNRISTLENLGEQYEAIIEEQKRLLECGLSHNMIEFLKQRAGEKKKTEEDLKGRINLEYGTGKVMTLQLNEINLKIENWKETIQILLVQSQQLNDTIEKLILGSVNSPVAPKPCSIVNGQADESIDRNENDEQIQKSILKTQNENLPTVINDNPVMKKVAFETGILEPQLATRRRLRRPGKVIQCQTVFIPSKR